MGGHTPYLRRMFSCTPAPPPLDAMVREATALVSSRIAPVPVPEVCLTSDVPAGSGMATPGTVWFSSRDAGVFAKPPNQWPPDRHVSMLHEVLHQVGMERGLEGGDDMPAEEGSVEAVAHDLKPAWLKRVMGRDRPVAVAYPGWVASVRRASATATRSTWGSAAARAWRAQLLATPPLQRDPGVTAQ